MSMEVMILMSGAALAGAVIGRVTANKRESSPALPSQVNSIPKITRQPISHPNWTPGGDVKQSHPYEGQPYKTIDPQELRHSMYPIIVSAIVPRPIALISTISKQGVTNLAPYSFFNVMSFDPPYVTIGALTTRQRPATGMKDSQENMAETGEFVINIVSHWMLEAANETCSDDPHNVSEWGKSTLTQIPSLKVKPPRVAESVVHLECVLRHEYPIPNREGHTHSSILIGEVVMMHANEGVLQSDGKGRPCINLEKLAPISKVGYLDYALMTNTIEMEMPNHEKH